MVLRILLRSLRFRVIGPIARLGSPYSFRMIPMGRLGAWITGNSHTTRPLPSCTGEHLGIKENIWSGTTGPRTRAHFYPGPTVLSTTRPRISTTYGAFPLSPCWDKHNWTNFPVVQTAIRCLDRQQYQSSSNITYQIPDSIAISDKIQI
jgi:hypothetical protein